MATRLFVHLGEGPEAQIDSSVVLNDVAGLTNLSLKQLSEMTGMSMHTLLAFKNPAKRTLPASVNRLLRVAGLTPQSYLHWKRTGQLIRPTANSPFNRMMRSLDRKLSLEYENGLLDDFVSQFAEQRRVRSMVADASLLDRFREARLTPDGWAKEAVRSVLEHPTRAMDFADPTALPTPRTNEQSAIGNLIRDPNSLRDRRRKGRPEVTVSVSADSVGSVGAALALANRADQYPFDTSITLDAATGAEQVFQLREAKSYGDVAVMGIPSSTLNMSHKLVENYYLVAVLHYLPLVLLAKDPHRINQIILARGGFAELFGNYYATRGTKYYERAFEVVFRGGFSPLTFAAKLPDGVGLLAFDPAATTMSRKHGLKKVRAVVCKRGVRLFRYGVHVCLFMSRSFFDPDNASHPNEALASQFVRAFLHEYLRCREYPEDTLDMLTEYLPFRTLYSVTAGLDD